MDQMNTIDNVLLVFNATFATLNIENIVGIILSVLTIIQIAIRLGFSIYDRIKKKDFKGLVEDIDKAKNELKDITESGDKNGR